MVTNHSLYTSLLVQINEGLIAIMDTRTQHVITLFVSIIIVMTAGCSGLGATGPANPAQESNTTDNPNESNVSNISEQATEGANNTSTSAPTSQSQDEDDSSSDDTSDSTDSLDIPDETGDTASDTSGSSGSNSNLEAGDQSNTNDRTQTANMRVYAEDKAKGGYLTEAQITVTNRETGETYTGTTHAGQEYDGNYVVFENLPLGTYQLTAQADGYKNATNTVQLTDSGRQPILQMEDRTATIQFTVVNQYGEPVPETEISIIGQEYGVVDIYTNENGKVTFGAPVHGEWHYSVLKPGYQTADVGGTLSVDGDMRKTIEIEQNVYNLTVDAGAADVPVMIERHQDGATTTKTTGSDGTIGFDVYPGDYTISTEGDQSQTVTVQDDRTVSLNSRQSQQATESNVTVDVNLPNSANLESTITLTGPEGETYSQESGMDGRATFTVPNGEYEYEITPTEQDRNYQLAMMEYSDTITVGPESSDVYKFMFFPEPEQLNAFIEVVNAETGEPIPNANIEAYSPSMSNPYKPAFSVDANSQGVYQETIPSSFAEYDYSVDAEGYATVSGSMSAQEIASHTFKLQPQTQTQTQGQTVSASSVAA